MTRPGYRNVQIAALCCFDTVGSLGIPMFGPARILKIFRSKHQFHDTDVTPGTPIFSIVLRTILQIIISKKK
jgi:hypothetical protein